MFHEKKDSLFCRNFPEGRRFGLVWDPVSWVSGEAWTVMGSVKLQGCAVAPSCVAVMYFPLYQVIPCNVARFKALI